MHLGSSPEKGRNQLRMVTRIFVLSPFRVLRIPWCSPGERRGEVRDGSPGGHRSEAGRPRLGISENTGIVRCPLAWSHGRWHDAISAYRCRDRAIGSERWGPAVWGTSPGGASVAWGSRPGGVVRRSRPAGGRRPRARNRGPVGTGGGRRGGGRIEMSSGRAYRLRGCERLPEGEPSKNQLTPISASGGFTGHERTNARNRQGPPGARPNPRRWPGPLFFVLSSFRAFVMMFELPPVGGYGPVACTSGRLPTGSRPAHRRSASRDTGPPSPSARQASVANMLCKRKNQAVPTRIEPSSLA